MGFDTTRNQKLGNDAARPLALQMLVPIRCMAAPGLLSTEGQSQGPVGLSSCTGHYFRNFWGAKTSVPLIESRCVRICAVLGIIPVEDRPHRSRG